MVGCGIFYLQIFEYMSNLAKQMLMFFAYFFTLRYFCFGWFGLSG